MKKTITALMLLCVVCFGQQAGSFKDPRDGKTYKTVKIGKQTWMAENLNYNASSSKCYDDKSANCNEYGRLYNWETAKSACPKGWHLPSKDEWQVLVDLAGGDEVAGTMLKARNGNGLDTYGFSALPGSYGNSGGSFYLVGSIGVLRVAPRTRTLATSPTAGICTTATRT